MEKRNYEDGGSMPIGINKKVHSEIFHRQFFCYISTMLHSMMISYFYSITKNMLVCNCLLNSNRSYSIIRHHFQVKSFWQTFSGLWQSWLNKETAMTFWGLQYITWFFTIAKTTLNRWITIFVFDHFSISKNWSKLFWWCLFKISFTVWFPSH